VPSVDRLSLCSLRLLLTIREKDPLPNLVIETLLTFYIMMGAVPDAAGDQGGVVFSPSENAISPFSYLFSGYVNC